MKMKSHYYSPEASTEEASHTLCVLVDNEPGVLGRVVGLFAGRGYNIDSLTVSEVDEGLSRITLVTSGTMRTIGQITAQLERLVPTVRVVDITLSGPSISRELALIKIKSTRDDRIEALRIADAFRARVLDATPESFIFELTGKAGKLEAFIKLMQPLGIVEVTRTGIVAITRGSEPL